MLCKACSTKVRVTKPVTDRATTKVCASCGVVNDITAKVCIVCAAPQTGDMWCCTCRQMLPYTQFYSRHDKERPIKDRFRSHCKVCERDRKKYRDRYNNKLPFEALSNALARDILSSLPTEPLTEEKWLKTCSLFEGCSICGAHDIQVRQFLIPTKNGGRYVAGNVLPMCPTCCNLFRFKSAINPLRLNDIKDKDVDLDRLDKIYTLIKERAYD